MITTAKDYRPKIISFPQTLTGLQIANKRSILWPCHAFRISIPARAKRTLNIFEETILKLCAIKKGDIQYLSELTCLDQEIVSFIIQRLVQLRLLNERLEPTADGDKLLEQLVMEPEDYEAAVVYIDLLSGHLLPVVTGGEIKLATVLELEENYVTFKVGSKGKKNDTRARKLSPNLKAFGSKIPSSEQVAKTIKRYQRLHKRYALLNDAIGKLPTYFPKAEAITVQAEADLVFLHCDVVVQRGNPDFIVTDGFGLGFSSIFKDYLEQSDAGWLINIKESALQEQLVEETEAISDHKLAMFSGGINRYPNIKGLLVLAETNWQRAQGQVETSSQEQENKSAAHAALKHWYAALEWTLRQVVSDYPAEQWEPILRSQSLNDNYQLLLGLAEKMGFSTQHSKALFYVPPGKIKALDKGGAEMQPLLALALAGASQESYHPLQHWSRRDRYCLDFVARLKKLRDTVAHGNSLENSIDGEELTRLRGRVHNLIKWLYPALQCEPVQQDWETEPERAGDIDQQRLLARIKLDNYFGLARVKQMQVNLLEELMKIELQLPQAAKEQGSRAAIVNSLAAALQTTLHLVLKELKNEGYWPAKPADLAQEKAIKANFKLSQGKLPRNIATVDKRRVQQAVHGLNPTLGANLQALLILMPQTGLELLAARLPELISLIGEIAELRGHGNTLQQTLPVSKLGELKERVYQIIKYLLEI